MALIKGGQLDKKWRIALDSQPLGTYFPLFTTTVADVPLSHIQHDWPNPDLRNLRRAQRVALNAQADVWQNYTPYYSSATYTAVRNDVVLASGTGTIVLTAAATVKTGGIICVKNIGTGVITINPTGAETIDGALTVTLSVQWAAAIMITDGANWFRLEL